jgi:hypothetical protein
MGAGTPEAVIVPQPFWYSATQGPRRTFASDSGDVADVAGNCPALVRSGGCTWANSEMGRALLFDGSTGYASQALTSPVYFINEASFSLSIWVYPTSFAAEQGLFDTIAIGGVGGRSDGFVLVQCATTGAVRCYSNGNYATSSALTLNLNRWNHVQLYRSAPTCAFRINGVDDLATTNALGGTLSGVSIILHGPVIGRYGDTAAGFFSGKIADVRLVVDAAPGLGEMRKDIQDPWRLLRNPKPSRSLSASSPRTFWAACDPGFDGLQNMGY